MMKRRIIPIFAFVLYAALSVFWLRPFRPETVPGRFSSSELKKTTVSSGYEERTDYTDDSGKITTASDLGYSTVIVTYARDSVTEAYFDPEGKPVSRYPGYYAWRKEYDGDGRTKRTVFLDDQGNPAVLALGYTSEEHSYDPGSRIDSVRFYDAGGCPVYSASEGYEKRNEYDPDGYLIRTEHLDENGRAMMIRKGYAAVTYTYYKTDGPENGKKEYEFYFDDRGRPVSLSYGQYGTHLGYDEAGTNTIQTYLDADGNPTVTVKGFTTVVRKYKGAGYTERYFDREGNPCALQEGQYGIRTENGLTTYLDKDGKEQINLKRLLYNHPAWIVAAALAAVLAATAINRKMNMAFLVLYCVIILYFTLMYRGSDVPKLNLVPFSEYRWFFHDSRTRSDIIMNIWLFIPLGAILYRLSPNRKNLLAAAAFSAAVEMTQYLLKIGWCGLDDIISNSLGSLIGFAAEKQIRETVCKLAEKRENKARPGPQGDYP